MQTKEYKTSETFTTISEWLAKLGGDFDNYRESGWKYIITLRDGVDQFGRTDSAKSELYEAAANQLGRSAKTLQNKVSIARKPYSLMAYNLGLEFAHLLAVQHLDDEHAAALLMEAAENFWDASELGYIAKPKSQATYPENGKSSTPTADAIDQDLSDDPPYADNTQYKDYDCTLPDAYDMDAYIAIPREPVAAARMLLREFDAGQIAALVAELVR